ncbi:hypothetical protein JQN72_04120 [Phycicoccus sp. CSK15P-2]|uniref:hypothetical protein n=1 Tax=Phycicoccus sp. CSK15P-2 TaxID=2807627 RepID=UPI00194DD3A2|nr:hypothetical protein [Phycicoccus sp. CSK15P-2]MBM6403429.1 hypothetical protein [Phycicoccus sp. CSK15P-2]
MTRRALALALALVAVLAGLGVTAASSGATPRAAAEPAGAVVLIGTGGISWSDIDEESTPNLWLLLRDGSSAALAARSVYSNTCPVDGWLGLSAGTRAAAPREGDTDDAADRACTGPPSVVSGQVAEWGEYERAARATSFDAPLGLLAEQAEDAGVCVRSVGRYAAAGGALPDGSIARWSDFDPDSLLVDLNACPVTLVDVGVVRDSEDLPEGEFAEQTRAEQVRTIDSRIGAVVEAGPNGADFVVASLADAGRSERLRLVVARGPHFGPGTLVSRSTRQVGLAQSPDLTATVLQGVGLDVPDSVAGAALTSNPAPDNSERRAASRLQTLRDFDESSHDVHDLVEPFFQVFAYGQLVVYLLVLLVWKGRIGSERTRTAVLSRVRTLSVAAAAVPVSTFLANLAPWWRFPVEMVALVAVVGAFVAVIATAALKGPWRYWALGPMAFVAAVTMAVLVVDIVTGSRLQLSSLMGLQPVVAGRFYGIGNPTFALFATASILLATAVSSALVLGGRRKAAAIAVTVIGLVALAIDAAPVWGADGGGPPALVPGIVSLLLAVLGMQMTFRRALAVALGVVLLFFAVAGLDWLRDPADRTHLGRFIQAMIDGTATDIVLRKGEQNLELIRETAPLSYLVPVAILVLAVVLARPTSWGSRALRRSAEQGPTLRAGLVALLLTLTIGFAVNDSGIAIPAVGAALAVPLIVSVTAATLLDEAREVSPTRAGRRRR